MVMVVFDSSGYWRTCRLNAALRPISRMSRLTTEDSTGRRMKMSVKAMRSPLLQRPYGRRHQCLRVVDLDVAAVEQLHLACGDDLLARGEARRDRDAVLPHLSAFHEAAVDGV